MSEQLDVVYDWMIKNGKKLNTQKTCKLCKKSSVDFYKTSTSVCKSCWNDYVKLSKREKKELGYEEVD